MKFGTLQVKYPDGKTVTFPLENPTILLGRAQGNDLLLEHPTVSRRHARLVVESGQLMVEDLGSANGSFLGETRLEPNTVTPVIEGMLLRLGDIELRYNPPPPLVPAAAEHTIRPHSAAIEPPLPVTPATPVRSSTPVSKPINISLISPAQPVMPGSTATATLTVQNRSAVVDEFYIRVDGVPADWVKLSKDRVPLLPDAQEKITITFLPPRKPEAAAGDRLFSVTVVSREHRSGETVRGILKLLPFQGVAMDLQPVRSRRDFTITLTNQGNIPVTYRLKGVDEEASLNYSISNPSVSLQPGQRARLTMQVKPKIKPAFGTRETRNFTISGLPGQEGPEARVGGQLIIRPPFPTWIIPVVGILLLVCLCLFGAGVYLTNCPTYAPDLPFCPKGPKPQINVFLSRPDSVDKGGTVVIGWDVTGAEQIELLSPVQKVLSGSAGTDSFSINQTSVFTLRATNKAGSVEQSFTVIVKESAPLINEFRAEPGAVISGQTSQVVLSWLVTGATSVSIIGVSQENLNPNAGSVTIPAPKETTKFVLVATNSAGRTNLELSVIVQSAGCVVTNIMEGSQLSVYVGPHPSHPVIASLNNGTTVEPIERNSTGDWLKIRAGSKEGWVQADYVTCAAGDFLAFPTANPVNIPTTVPSPTATLTPTPTQTPTPTETPTITPTFSFQLFPTFIIIPRPFP